MALVNIKQESFSCFQKLIQIIEATLPAGHTIPRHALQRRQSNISYTSTHHTKAG
jgi:hypothetical protein